MKKSSALYPLVALVACLLPLAGFAFELHPQLGHTTGITSVAYSPDGKYLVSAGDDQTARLWELASGKEIRAFLGHTERLSSVAFSPDGKYLASASFDRTVKLWEVDSGKEIRSFKGHTEYIMMVTFSPDGTYLASACWDKTIRLWEVSSGQQLRSFVEHTSAFDKPSEYTNRFMSAAFTPDGKYLISASTNQAIRVWEVSSGKELRSFKGHTSSVASIALSADGKYLASASFDRTVKLWEVDSGKEIRSFKGHTDALFGVAFSADGKYLASASNDRTVKLWGVDSGKEIYSFKGHTTSVAFSPDGKHLASGDAQAVRLWEVSSGKELRSLSGHANSVYSIAFSPDGKHLASAGDAQMVRLWELGSGKKIRSFKGHTGYINAAAFSPDGRYLASASGDKTLKLWEVASGKELRSFKGHTGYINSVAYSPDGKYLASVSYDKTVRLWEVSSGKEIRSFLGHTDVVRWVEFSPDGKYLASVSWDKTVRLWDVASGKEIRSFNGHTEPVMTVVFSPDGKHIASASNDKTVRLWEVDSGKEIRSFIGHTDWALSAAFSADGKYLASASYDHTVRLWEAASGKEIRAFLGHTHTVNSVAFSPDGKYIASASMDGTTRLWRVDSKDSMVMMSSLAGEVMVSSTEGEWLIYTDDGLFDASPGGVELVAAVEGMHGYNIDQLALKNNRPDLILKRMGLGTPELLDYYYKRYLNRLKKAKLDEAKLDSSFLNLPQSTITETKLSSSGQEAEVSVTLEDKAGLKSYQVYVNGVASYEGFGKEVSGTKQTIKENIALTQGENRIEVSILNVGGQESFRALAVMAGPAKLNKDLYFVGFGVSDYADKDITDLSYANKDAKELGEEFGKLQGYDNRFVKTYTNEQVTKASITEAKEFFKKAKPQDTVVLFIAGHGIHDRDGLATYYYIIHNTQIAFAKDGTITIDAATAVSFEEIEGLLSGIQAKQKLFLMDTCESGEREDSDVTLALAGATSRSLNARAIGIAKVKAAPKKAPKKAPPVKSTTRPWLLERDRYIYKDLAKRTGAIVFSSSKGGEYSYESKELENGLFTEAILKGLSGKAADKNKDGQISTDELRGYVSQDVATLSGDLQHPTVDRDNLYLRLSFVP